MKVTLNWLKQYVDFDWSAEELAERLTMLGIEVEGVQKLGGEFEGVVVAQVITHDKHPNADKLSVCRVNDGKGERQIVCGAQNFKAGRQGAADSPGPHPARQARRGAVHHQGGQNPRRRIARHDVFAAGTGPGRTRWRACSSCAKTPRSASLSPNISAGPAATWSMTWKSRRTGPT